MMKRIICRFDYYCLCAKFLVENRFIRFATVRGVQLPPAILDGEDNFEAIRQVLEGGDCMLRRHIEEFVTLVYGSTEQFYRRMKWFKSSHEQP